MTTDKASGPVGIIAAMPMEARALGVSGPFNEIIPTADNTLSYVCGIGPENARRATTELLAAGATAIVSWGTAGGLSKEFEPGTALLASSVVCADAAYESDRAWITRLREHLAELLTVSDRAIYSGGLLVSGIADKESLAEDTGAVAVDMESGVIAETAVAAHIPFVCIRVIADPVSFALPPALGAALDDNGFVSLRRAFRAMQRNPRDIVPMLQTALHFRRATQVLSLIYKTAGPRLLAP